MKKTIFLLALTLLAALPMGAQEKDHDFQVAKNMDLFNAIYKNLDMLYVDSLDPNEVVGNGIDAMLRSLDPYTDYYPEEKTRDLKTMLTGKYAGIGALIQYNFPLKRVCIGEPYAGMPAAEAGLRKGDIILAIDDSSMVGKDNAYVSQRLRGEPGTSFVLTYQRPGLKKPTKVKITRRAIQLPSLPYYGLRPSGVGYINYNQFTEGSAREVRRAFIDLKRRGAKGLILDLRGNGGGSVDEAIDILSMFVPKGTSLLKMKGKIARANREYRTSVEPIDSVMPIVCLVNGQTASASEITSGALQDLDRGVVLGTRTFGKGLVQVTMDLPYNANMKLTTAKYYIPSGRCIQAINYKHSRGGYTEHVPDSLTHEFLTLGGRKVRDGGGIKPDVEVQPDTLSNLAVYLQSIDTTSVMLNYEVAYIQKHPQIAPAGEFELSDQDYEDFKQQVIKSKFTYDVQSAKFLDDLEKVVKFEGYYDDAKQEFEALRKKLKHDVGHDLDIHKDEINDILSSDIATVYYYQAGAIENGLRHDKQVKAAEDLLLDQAKYAGILQPAEKK